jgi:hypothetical protein
MSAVLRLPEPEGDAARLMELFAGYEEAHGTHGDTDVRGLKLEIKRTARTIREPVTLAHWQAHVEGRRALGIVPIRADGTCLWACIDIDDYAADTATIVAKVERLGIPLVPCRSKSGGLHVYLFLRAPESATEVRKKLRAGAAAIGHPDAEIFPKQDTLDPSRGDAGNWLNMPYFGGDRTDRYALKKNGLAMSLREFLDYAEGRRAALSEIEVAPAAERAFGDGPPCLEHLAATRVPQGSRNNALFAMGTYLKKKHGDAGWAEEIEKCNQLYLHPPLPAEEVVQIKKSLKGTSYTYRCGDQPLCAHCKKQECQTRPYGIGGEDARNYPVIEQITIVEDDPPRWRVRLAEVGEVELPVSDCMKYGNFAVRCAERLGVVFSQMKEQTWRDTLGAAMKDAKRELPEAGTSTDDMILEELESFLVGPYSARAREDILTGMPWLNEEESRYEFRITDFMRHLKRDNPDLHKLGRRHISLFVQNRVKGGGRYPRGTSIKGKSLNLWWVPRETFEPLPEVPLPPSKRSAV